MKTAPSTSSLRALAHAGGVPDPEIPEKARRRQFTAKYKLDILDEYDRLTEPGDARRAAVALAADLASLPQRCLREDRASSYEQWGLELDEAIAAEYAHGMRVLAAGDAVAGASRFAAGAGRHGAPESPDGA